MASVADLVEPWVVGDGLDLSLLGRARHLVARGAVVPSAFGPRLVEATVTADEGAELASLRATGSRLDWACSCAAADRRPDDGDPCIHVVATAQVAWARAGAPPLTARRPGAGRPVRGARQRPYANPA